MLAASSRSWPVNVNLLADCEVVVDELNARLGEVP
jgi:hypothetical protein